MDLKYIVGGLVVAIGLTGCSSHNSLNIVSSSDVKKLSNQSYQAHNNDVFLIKKALPENIKYKEIATLDVGSVWYGSEEVALKSLSVEAKKIGADAVINVKTWHQPSGWSWKAPQGSGVAIKLSNNNDIKKLKQLDGVWR